MFDTIKCDIGNNYFVWKSPIENFNTGANLIVGPAQEALFIYKGEVLDTLSSGQHTLSTQTLPLLSKVLNILYNDNTTPFRCEIYFINKTEQPAIKWGTDSPIIYNDPQLNIPISLGMNGEMTLRVDNSKKLFMKLVGAETNLSQEKLVSMYRGTIKRALNEYVPKYMRENNPNLFNINENLSVFSEDIQKMISERFDEYGVDLVHFYVNYIKLPEGDRNFEQFRNLYLQEALLKQEDFKTVQELKVAERDKLLKMKQAEAEAESRRIQGYTYQQEKQFDIAQAVASNEGVGQYTNLGVGLSVMNGVGNAVGGALADSISGNVQPVAQKNNNGEDPEIILSKLKSMLDKNLISQDQYDSKVKEILERM